tara:strand:+ start:384 stop:1193 length:810 start_codon:yes stop_codon:yes gene_type:complete
MKLNHNKKRNTAFLYESLIKELTKASIKKDNKRAQLVLSIIKEHFTAGSALKDELDVYKSIYETKNVSKAAAKSIIIEARRVYSTFNQKKIFNAQSKLINDINKRLGAETYGYYVPNYKALASINQIFSQKPAAIRSKIMLEGSLVDHMTKKEKITEEKTIDQAAMKLFGRAFNKEYKQLHESQKSLLKEYVGSFHDGGLQLKVYLNEEIGELKKFFNQKIKTADHDDVPGLKEIVTLLESYKGKHITDKLLIQVIKMQGLQSEMITND